MSDKGKAPVNEKEEKTIEKPEAEEIELDDADDILPKEDSLWLDTGLVFDGEDDGEDFDEDELEKELEDDSGGKDEPGEATAEEASEPAKEHDADGASDDDPEHEEENSGGENAESEEDNAPSASEEDTASNEPVKEPARTDEIPDEPVKQPVLSEEPPAERKPMDIVEKKPANAEGETSEVPDDEDEAIPEEELRELAAELDKRGVEVLMQEDGDTDEKAEGAYGLLSMNYYWFHDFAASPIGNIFEETDTPWDALEKVTDAIETVVFGQEGPIAHSTANIAESAIVTGPVIIGKNVIVGANAIIEGPAIIGNDSLIENGACIRPNTAIGSNCRIGRVSEVAHCVLMDGSSVGPLAAVNDSIIGANAFVGTGSITESRNFDYSEIFVEGPTDPRTKTAFLLPSGTTCLGVILGDMARVGSNVTLLPGTTIGPSCYIHAGAIVGGFVPEAKEVRFEGILEMSDIVALNG